MDDRGASTPSLPGGPDIAAALAAKIPEVHILISDGRYQAAAKSIAEALESVLLENRSQAGKAIAYLASCKTTEEVESQEISRRNAADLMRLQEEERLRRDEAILVARASLDAARPDTESQSEAGSEVTTRLVRELGEDFADAVNDLLCSYSLQLKEASVPETPVINREQERYRRTRQAFLAILNPISTPGAPPAGSGSSRIAPATMNIFDGLDPESVNLSRIPRRDLGESGATGDDLLAECIVYGFQGNGEHTWNDNGSRLAEPQVAWAIRLGRALEHSEITAASATGRLARDELVQQAQSLDMGYPDAKDRG